MKICCVNEAFDQNSLFLGNKKRGDVLTQKDLKKNATKMELMTYASCLFLLNNLKKIDGETEKYGTAGNVLIGLLATQTVTSETARISNEWMKGFDEEKENLTETRRNNLTALLRKDPFQIWKYKSRWESLSDLKLEDGLMSKAIQPGDPSRLKKVFTGVFKKGKPVNILIIGGSNSAGGKLKEDENSLDGLYFEVFTDWWNAAIGKTTGAFAREYKEPIGGTGSYFFAYCYKTFIPKGVKIDIVLIEASINYNTVGKAEPLEQLTRLVLSQAAAPAVLYVNLVSGLGLNPKTKTVFNPNCLNLENFGQGQLARHYGITSISLKEILCRKINGKWEVALKNMAATDGRHIGLKAHAQVGMMMVEYVRSVFKQLLSDSTGALSHERQQLSAKSPSLKLPEALFLKRGEALTRPLCWTGVTPDKFQNLHRPTLQIQIVQRKGFSPFPGFHFANAHEQATTSTGRTDAQGGWYAWNHFSRLQIRIFIPNSDFGTLSASRSVTILTRTSGSGGKAQIWLDDEKTAAIFIDSKSVFGNNWLDTIASRVSPGFHIITVRTLRKGMFLVSGILVGPPDFQRRGVL